MGMFGKAPGDEKPREIPEEGKYPALLYLLVDLGTHRDEYKGEVKFKRKIHLGWELVGTKMSDGRPFAVFQEYNVSSSKYDAGFYFPPNSNIHKMLKAWTGEGENKCKSAGFLESLLDEQFPCTITIEHQTARKDDDKVKAVAALEEAGKKEEAAKLQATVKVYANIESIKPYKGKDKIVRSNDPVKYLIGGDLDGFPDTLAWLKKKIGQAMEFNGGVPSREVPNPDPNNGFETGGDPDIPF